MAINRADSERLRALEAGLWQARTRFDRAWMERTLAPDFSEFGRSGRVYARDDTLEVPAQAIDAELSDVRLREIASDVVLVTYRSRVRDGADILLGNRASLWSRSGGEWRLRFHQGTPAFETP